MGLFVNILALYAMAFLERSRKDQIYRFGVVMAMYCVNCTGHWKADNFNVMYNINWLWNPTYSGIGRLQSTSNTNSNTILIVMLIREWLHVDYGLLIYFITLTSEIVDLHKPIILSTVITPKCKCFRILLDKSLTGWNILHLWNVYKSLHCIIISRALNLGNPTIFIEVSWIWGHLTTDTLSKTW